MSLKKMSYGDAEALKVLVAERLGFNPTCVEVAKDQLMGKPIHPIKAAQVSKVATDFHNRISVDENVVASANKMIVNLMSEYGFAGV